MKTLIYKTPEAMKTLIHIALRIGIIVIFLSGSGAMYAQNGNDSFVTVTGKLKDAKTGDKIIYANISVPGTAIGTVSNSEGEFLLKVDKSLNIDVFEVAHLSYTTTKFKISESVGKDKTFYIEPKVLMLSEITIVPKDARSVVEAALSNIRKNYSDVPNMMTGFYRETIRQKRDYVSISEAVVDIYKAAYQSMQDDQVKIYKGRKGTNVKKADTLMVQLQGGPNIAMLLDIVKNTDLSIALDNLDNYQFEYASMVNIDEKPNWVISFAPNVVKEEPLYYGKLYISQEKMAITRAEFSLDLKDEDKASRVFVQKKPMGLIFMPTSTSYLVTYKEQNNKLYLNYVRVDLKFRCDWKKRLFKNYYTVMSEVAITDRHEDNITKFASKETFKPSMVFADKVQNFSDPNFWGNSNIIEPEESIENAIKKLSKSMSK
jgi:hypothetical protein